MFEAQDVFRWHPLQVPGLRQQVRVFPDSPLEERRGFPEQPRVQVLLRRGPSPLFGLVRFGRGAEAMPGTPEFGDRPLDWAADHREEFVILVGVLLEKLRRDVEEVAFPAAGVRGLQFQRLALGEEAAPSVAALAPPVLDGGACALGDV